ncbi:MAG: hypothetical protein HYV09_31215 [Deltaproteobacteria bacterium]|nr:hypothetical protein [Deltaproteobacteria bacterium]
MVRLVFTWLAPSRGFGVMGVSMGSSTADSASRTLLLIAIRRIGTWRAAPRELPAVRRSERGPDVISSTIFDCRRYATVHVAAPSSRQPVFGDNRQRHRASRPPEHAGNRARVANARTWGSFRGPRRPLTMRSRSPRIAPMQSDRATLPAADNQAPPPQIPHRGCPKGRET